MTFPSPHMNHVMALKRVIAEVAGLKVACESMGQKSSAVIAKVPEAVGDDQLTPFAARDTMAAAMDALSRAEELFGVAERDLRLALGRIGDPG